MAAANFLSQLSTTNLVLRSDFRRLFHAHPLQPQILNNSWLGTKLWLQPQPNNVRTPVSKLRPFVAIVSFSLPTADPERVSSGQKVPKWSSKAIKSFAMAELEARKLKYPNTGTESLLMGVLIEGTSPASKYLRANGITLLKVRDEALKALGKADLYFFSPEHPPLTEEAQRALDWAVDRKLNSGHDGEITTTHLLLGIWAEAESPGHKILAALGFDAEKAKELEALISNPKFTDD
ncbi:ATP-dependent Clp protease ATP-binding subunit CLPT2, chloroplastic [Neltuma alba]|uniref:ATP-dependent Clp protease ATP-binding subunit CLPT2, chloroplastic n=1 Tax=Neltuma alba TaxID=207710 RepID=UPI0010A4226D|nr:ATP-dependent Clp protease ATP-binding subunit CLPT2, chloroplastic-like [Prosopis alba]